MANISLYVVIVTIVFGIFFQKSKLSRIEKVSIGKLGKSENPPDKRKSGVVILNMQIAQYKKQQVVAFCILVLSILLFLTISSVALFRIVLDDVLDLSNFAKAVGIVGGFTLSVVSFQLLRYTSKKYDEKVKALLKVEKA